MIDYEEDIINFQKLYMETMSDIRSENMFTFPVSTISLLRKDNKFEDENFAEWAIKHNMKWSDSNFFIDDNVSSLSNCCFDGDQKVLVKSSGKVIYTTFKELDEMKSEDKKNLTVFHNGSWVKGKIVKMPKRKMYKVTTANNKIMYLTDNHINVTLTGEKPTSSLTENDYLMFNSEALDTFPEQDEGMTYNEGFLIGMYLGDGNMSDEEETTHQTLIALSLNKEKYTKSLGIISNALETLKINAELKLGILYNNVYPVTITSSRLAEFIRKYVKGKYCNEKELDMYCLTQSKEFRRGILDGYYLTDGGNSNRIYTTSKNLAENLETMITSLGLHSIIDITDRTDEKITIRGQEFTRNFPTYCIRWYDRKNKRSRNGTFIVKNNSTYFKIKSIEDYETEYENVYCFEMPIREPYFTLPNGIITHNCRLKSNVRDLGYFNSVGGTALKVGSIKVSTINLARIALDTNTKEEYLKELEIRTLSDVRVLDIIRNIIKRDVEKGLLPNFSYHLVDFEHLYNTIGFIGIYETMKKFGCVSTDKFGNSYYTKEAAEFGKKIFDTMRKVANDFIAENHCDYIINTEQIPAESASAKLMRKDKFFYPNANIYDLPLYGNQFIPLGISTTLNERIRIQAMFDGFCNGGSILHANIDKPFDNYDKAYKMVCYIADAGVTYFAFNTKIQACKENHAFYGTVCPVCGKPVTTEYTRIVGFYTPISTWSSERKAEYDMRKWENINVFGDDI